MSADDYSFGSLGDIIASAPPPPTPTGPVVKEFDLVESLQRHLWVKLPLAALRDVGPAAQTLGGILKISRRDTFIAAKGIAKQSRVPLPTARRHLRILEENGWIENDGRQRTKAGRPRRTCTRRPTSKARAAAESNYSCLPWWATGHIGKIGRLQWSTQVLLSLVMERMMSLQSVCDKGDGAANLDPDDLWASIEELGGDDRFRFPLSKVHKRTGLSKASIINAKRDLKRLGIVSWMYDEREDGSLAPDVLFPRRQFKVIETPAGNGMCYLDFDKGVVQK